jgi:hypothetical protein
VAKAEQEQGIELDHHSLCVKITRFGFILLYVVASFCCMFGCWFGCLPDDGELGWNLQGLVYEFT